MAEADKFRLFTARDSFKGALKKLFKTTNPVEMYFVEKSVVNI
jgi:hypothetical protein